MNYLVLFGLVVFAALCVFRYAPDGAPATPLEQHAPCWQTAAGATPAFVCSDGHLYVHQGKSWRDGGHVSYVPPVPTG